MYTHLCVTSYSSVVSSPRVCARVCALCIDTYFLRLFEYIHTYIMSFRVLVLFPRRLFVRHASIVNSENMWIYTQIYVLFSTYVCFWSACSSTII